MLIKILFSWGYSKWDGRTTYPKSPPRESGKDEEDWSSWYKEEMVHGMEGVNEVEAGSNSSLPELEDCSEEDDGSNCSMQELSSPRKGIIGCCLVFFSFLVIII